MLIVQLHYTSKYFNLLVVGKTGVFNRSVDIENLFKCGTHKLHKVLGTLAQGWAS